jgi:hypothetical protein
VADLAADLTAGYPYDESSWIRLGRPLGTDLEGTVNAATVGFPLGMLNRHGLVAGATGTGKTKTLQLFAEQLSAAGVPVFLADLKGDLSGLAAPGPQKGFIDERMAGMDLPWEPTSYPVELLSLTGAVGTPLRVPLQEFGPILLAKVLDASDVQESVLQVIFQYAIDADRPLVTIADLSDLLRFLASDEGEAVQDEYGGMGTSTLNVLRRELVALRGQGGEVFFGAPGFDVADLRRVADDGRGVISIVNLVDVQTKPRIFSTFLLWLLSAVYATAPEVGDADRPELVFFFDEAHLLFDGASSALTELVELTVRMIRSKGVGVFFVTQVPTDVPDDVLGQLGNRIQHALRAFTPDDQRALQQTAATFPISKHYDVRQALTGVGIGEALITGLDPDGSPMPTVATRLVAPTSDMDPASAEVVAEVVAASAIREKYTPATAADPAAGTGPSTSTAGEAAAAVGAAGGAGPAVVAADGAGAAPATPAPGAALHTCGARRLELAAARPPRSLQVEEVDVRTGRSMKANLRDDLAPAEVGELAVAADELRFVSGATELGLPRSEVGTLRVASGLLVIATSGGDHAFQLDTDDLAAVLAGWFPDGVGVDVRRLAPLPDDLLERLGAAPTSPRGRGRDADERDEEDDDEPGRLAEMATSTAAEDVVATGLKALGVNKGTTRSVFRSLRKLRKR